MTTDLGPVLIQSLVTLFSGGTGAVVVSGVLSHRRTAAEADKTHAETGKTQAEIVGVGTNTAATQVDTAMDMLREMRVDMATLRDDLGKARLDIASARQEAAYAKTEAVSATAETVALREWRNRHEQLMAQHLLWDEQVMTVVRDLGGNIGTPPPLTDDDPHLPLAPHGTL